MNKNIYDLLNDTQINLNDYEVETMSELEQKRAFNNFSKGSNKKGKHYKKYIAVASVALVSFGTIGMLPTFATLNPTAYKIASMLGIEKDLGDYITAVNTPVTQQGITIGLGEVAYDKINKELIVTTYMTSDAPIQNKEDHTLHDIHTRIYINGRELNMSSNGISKLIDDHTIGYITRYNMKEELDGNCAMSLQVPRVVLDDQIYQGSWKFEFNVDGDQLATDTQVIPIGASIPLQEDSALTLTHYTHNALGSSIYYRFEGVQVRDFYELRGTDNLGNPVVFALASGIHGQEGEFTLADENATLSPEAQSITLTLYTSTVVGEGEAAQRSYQATGEAFTIDLTQQ